MSDAPAPAPAPLLDERGKTTSLVVYLLYFLSWPTVGLMMIVGVIVAYNARAGAAPWVRTHLDKEIKVFWTTIIWSLVGAVLAGVGWATSWVFGLGFLLVGASAVLFVVLAIWFHLVSLFGLIHLTQDRPA